MTPKIIGVLAEYKIGDVDRQVLNIGERGAQFRQNHGHPTKLLKSKVGKLGDEGGLLAVTTRRPKSRQITTQKIRDLNARIDAINTGSARSWFRKLTSGTIDTFGDLSRLFVTNFMICRRIPEVEIMAMMEGLRPGPLFDSLSKNVSETLSTLQSKDDKYIAAEELTEAKQRRRRRDDKRKESKTRQANYRDEARNKRSDRYSRKDQRLIPGKGTRTDIANHWDIQVIHGGFGSGGCSSSSKKRHARSASGRAEEEIYNLSSTAIDTHPPITFNNDDLKGLHLRYDDALVVSAVIANFNSPTRPPFGKILLWYIALRLSPEDEIPHTWTTNIRRGQGDHLDLSPEDEIPHFDRNRQGKGRPKDPIETENTKPLEEIAPISIHPDYLDRHVMIDTELTGELRFALTHLTYEFLPDTTPQAISAVTRAFNQWASAMHFTFSQVQVYANANMKISFHRRDHGDGHPFEGPGGTLAHAWAPRDGRFHYDSEESWSVGAVRGSYDLETVALHEIGHLLGLDHSSVQNAINLPNHFFLE
ncbi:Metalloendoproteinase [Actinidia chinensis var. chinensis]|uniref:Metalloendoproteinase n=1 Tax=Actinidia chinensis var. chinensis TaxID=1590841 RepID=A0A2R6RYY2_ACTCC|nr:Metalloendoproteinase [Actinidia chinensis var. chinensis]